MSFTRFLQDPVLGARYRKVKRYFFLRESAYDVTSACQLRCEGCYYFEGDKYRTRDNRDPEAWRAFFEAEKARGITFVVLAGAEPALVPRVIRACHEVLPLGTVASNGLKRIDPEIRYRVHLSVWGDETGDPIYRKLANGKLGPYCLPVQLENYAGDDRPVFVYTFNHDNVDQVDECLRRVEGAGHKMTFNVFSIPERNGTALKLRDQLQRTREKMFQCIDRHPGTVLYSYYNAIVHTSERSLDGQFGCSYPRALWLGGRTGTGISETFRSYRTDLTHTQASDCCVPDIDCADCRHYAAGSAVVSSRLDLHVGSEAMFRAWLDYVDTYLSVWVLGYDKGENLFRPGEHHVAGAGERLHQIGQVGA